MSEEQDFEGFETAGSLALKEKRKPEFKYLVNLKNDGTKEIIQKAIENASQLNLQREDVQDVIGIHYRTWHSLRNSRFERIHKHTLEKLQAFNERCKRQKITKDKQESSFRFIEIENVRKIRLTLMDCIENYKEGIYIVLGPSGCGKTSALNAILSELKNNQDYSDWKIIKVHAHEHHSCKSILCEIGRELGLDLRKDKTTSALLDRIPRTLNAKKTLIVFDEADWLMDRRKLNLLRTLWDKSPFACYLLGVDEIIENFYRNHAGNRQLVGRIYGFVRLNNLSIEDVFKFFDDCGLSSGSMERIYTLTGGNAHLIRKMLKKIRMFAKNGMPITESATEEIYKNLMFAGQF